MATSSNRDKMRVIALSVLIVFCAGFVGGLLYLHSRPEVPPFAGVPHDTNPQLVAETEARKRDKILDLRDKWQVWAKAHQPQLKTMLHAQRDDLAALAGVADAIPASPAKESCGISPEDLGGMANYSDPMVVMVSYSHFGMDAIPARPELASENEKAKQNIRLADRVSFELMRDVLVASTSSAWSKKNYCLFASGRVTEGKLVIPGMKQDQVELKPPYDFLGSSKRDS